MRQMTRTTVFTLLFAPLAALGADAPPPAAPPPAASQAQDAAMAAWIKAATPGEEHKKLEAFAGTYTAKVKVWMDEKAPPQESDGAGEMKMIMGGRYLEQRHSGTFMGQPFSGVGYTGYDNLKKVYVSVWLDDHSTAMMYTNGKWDATGTVLQSGGKMDDPVTGKPKSIRTQVRKVDGGGFVYEIWEPDAAGKFFRTLEVTYTKK